MTFGELIKKWNNGRAEGAQTAFARKIGTNVQNMSHWVNGRYQPEESVKRKIAKETGLSLEEVDLVFVETKAANKQALQGVRDERDDKYSALPPGITNLPESLQHLRPMLSEPQILPANLVPVVGEVSAETFRFSLEHVADEYILAPIPAGKTGFALRVKGDCMNPKAQDGDYAICVKVSEVKEGDPAIVCFDDECTLKRVHYKKDHLELSPDNPKFKALKVAREKARIVGQVIGYFRKP